MNAATVHVVGAGMAGLSAAVALAAQGVRVEVAEAAMQAGGRCRSYVDPALDMTIDNGNHFVLSGNQAVFHYLHTIGAEQRLHGPEEAVLDFHDVAASGRWRIHANQGLAPWWLLRADRRVPGTRLGDYLPLLALLRAGPTQQVEDVIACQGMLWERLLGPFLLGALNTRPEIASAALAGAVIRESLARGGAAYRVRIAHPSLSAAFVDPALAFLEARGAPVRFGARLRAFSFDGDRIAALQLGDQEVGLGPGDSVVLATPPWIAQELIAGLVAPDRFSPIVNGHFRITPPPGAAPMVGVIGGTAQWVFAFDDRLSVTVSAADDLVDENREVIAQHFWRDVAAVHGLGPDLPPWQIVKERRATFEATPEQNAKRPGATTAWRNLFLAGDWTATSLPATIEGAIRSGVKAAELAVPGLRGFAS